MPTTEELRFLLQFPSESLTLEYKSWLDLTENVGKAVLAKAAIALANEGGGIIVLGMREANSEGGALRSLARPADIARYSQDAINAAIARYSEPEFHCGLMFAAHPDIGHEHAFIIVPGGMTVPVMCYRGCEGIISAQRCYVRKPGPRSEEPYTAEEWRGVMERCLHARRESMLDAIRVIVQGRGTPLPQEARGEALMAFADGARARWRQLIDGLPPNDAARMPLGHYELVLEFAGVRPAETLVELRRRMDDARRIRHTGWGPFVDLSRAPIAPQPVDGNVECWLGHPAEERYFADAAHSDFWRANPAGRFFLLRGYDEDATERIAPGTVFDVTMPVWRIGEALLFAARLAELFEPQGAELLVQCRYSGLRNRRLDSVTGRRSFRRGYICADDGAELETHATAQQISDNLIEILHQMLSPLYERFAFFELPIELVREEIERMTQNRF